MSLSFGLSFCFHQQDELLDAQNTPDLYAILRCDPVPSDELLAKIMKDAINDTFDLGSKNELDELRDQIFQENIDRLGDTSDNVYISTDDTDDTDETDEDGLECMVCIRLVPEFYCDQCALLFCEKCIKNYDGHVKNHKIKYVN